MTHGQICRIQIHDNQDPKFNELVGSNGGWFIKLKGDDGQVKFHLVDDGRTKEVSIDANLVDESMRNSDHTKPFYVVCVFPTSMIPLVTHVTSEFGSMVHSGCLNDKIEALRKERENECRQTEKLQEKIRLHTERVAGLKRLEADLRNIADMSEPYYLYAYGKHTADGQEYAWRVPYSLYEQVRVGATVLVDTGTGSKHVVVTRLEKCEYLLGHKLVISVGC